MKVSTSQGILFDNSTKMLNNIFCKCTVKPVNKDYQEKLAKWSYMCIEHSSSWQNIVISEVRQYISSVKQVVLVQVWLSILHVYTYCLLMVTNLEKKMCTTCPPMSFDFRKKNVFCLEKWCHCIIADTSYLLMKQDMV